MNRIGNSSCKTWSASYETEDRIELDVNMGFFTHKFAHNLSWRVNLMFLSTITVIASQIFRTYCDAVYNKAHIYTLSAVDINGKNIPFHSFRGKVLLIVNVATYCGFTQTHYKELVEIQKKFAPKGFTVLAFPCNQFGEQEPDTNEEIIEFLKQVYKVNFHVFQKIDVVGNDAHPLYKFLADQTGKVPTWNFWKYLVDHKGNVINAWSPATSVQSLTDKIQNALDAVGMPKEAVYSDEL